MKQEAKAKAAHQNHVWALIISLSDQSNVGIKRLAGFLFVKDVNNAMSLNVLECL